MELYGGIGGQDNQNHTEIFPSTFNTFTSEVFKLSDNSIVFN